jgi:hypothetical protein
MDDHVEQGLGLIYLKCVVVGMAAALVASAIFILVVFVFPILLPFLLSRITGTGGAAGASFSDVEVLGIAVIAFAVGFYWQLRKGSEPRRRAR